MAVKPGYKRIPELEYLMNVEGWSEEAMQATDIPEEAEIINIVNEFENGGPVTVSYRMPENLTPEAIKRNRKNLQDAIDYAFDEIIARYNSDPEYRKELNLKFGIAG